MRAIPRKCHEGAMWECLGCERDICGVCEPSPGESETCADCWDTELPDDAA